MKWKDHGRWAEKMEISEEIANYVDNLIDAIKKGKPLPKEYTDFVHKESEKEANSKKKAVAMFIEDITLSHDSARRSDTKGIPANIQLKFLRQKGEYYVDAWYLHHALDYLEQNKDFMKNTQTSIESMFNTYKKNKPQTYSENIIDFLKNNIQELKKDLDL